MTNLAYVFPGQGSQSLGMLSDLTTSFPIILETFNEVSETLGYDVWKLIQTGPETQLNQTEFTQVAMLTADVALYRAFNQLANLPAKFMAGHSLGEYAALVCAGALDLTSAAHLVEKRGQLMQQFVPIGKGAMAAIVGLNDEEVNSLCKSASDSANAVSPANYNALGQVVIAGHSQAVLKAIELAEQAGARLAKIIPVSVPCHCSLLSEAADAFADYLMQAPFKVPSDVAVVSNVDLSIYSSVQQIRQLLKAQLYSPVRWVETIQMFKTKSIELIIECGPGRVLTGLIKRIDRNFETLSVFDQQSLKDASIQLHASTGCS